MSSRLLPAQGRVVWLPQEPGSSHSSFTTSSLLLTSIRSYNSVLPLTTCRTMGLSRSVAKTQRSRSTVFVHGQKVYLTSRNDLTMNKRQRYRRRVCGGKRVRGVYVVRHLADDGTRAGHQRSSRFLIRVFTSSPPSVKEKLITAIAWHLPENVTESYFGRFRAPTEYQVRFSLSDNKQHFNSNTCYTTREIHVLCFHHISKRRLKIHFKQLQQQATIIDHRVVLLTLSCNYSHSIIISILSTSVITSTLFFHAVL